MDQYSHYFKDVSHLSKIDVYRVLDLFSVTDPAIQHAIKKLLVAGGRGHKDVDKDIREAIDACNRSLAMRAEDAARSTPSDGGESGKLVRYPESLKMRMELPRGHEQY